MRHALAGLLLTGATGAFVLATPAAAQVAGNPGDLHTPTVYTSGVQAPTYGYAPGYGGPLGPLGVLATPVAGPVAGGAPCAVQQDFNGRYTALCGL
jgi:hypothetical protein